MGKQLQPCGTETAFRRHYKRGQEPCDICRDAHRLRLRNKNHYENMQLHYRALGQDADQILDLLFKDFNKYWRKHSNDYWIKKAQQVLMPMQTTLHNLFPEEQ